MSFSSPGVWTTSVADEIDADVCIVGAGPAGINIARELAGTGVRVCLLESGGADVERRVQRQSKGESDGYPVHLLHQSRLRAFGGTLRHPRVLDGGWAARPLDPVDFEVRAGVPYSGWPFGREHLLPYYERAARVAGLPAAEATAEGWLPIQDSEIEPTAFQFSEVDFTDVRAALSASANVRLLLRHRVVETTVDSTRSRVETITAVRPDRSRVVVHPRAVVFAAGGIENVRLLLTADGGRGLGNEHDLVGRYFAERLALRVGYVVPLDDRYMHGAPFFERHGVVSGAVRIPDRVLRDKGLLNCGFWLIPRPAAFTKPAMRSLATLRKAMIRRPLVDGFGAHVRNVMAGIGDVAAFAVGRATGRPNDVLVMRAHGEQAPNRDSRVTLGTRRDDLGIPVARVSWRIADSDRESLRVSVDIVGAALRTGGFGLLHTILGDDLAPLVEGGHHHMGSTRMHADPRRGVVDADGRVHSMANLYITGSSVFPTYGLSNPTLTIVALAVRLADHLRDALR